MISVKTMRRCIIGLLITLGLVGSVFGCTRWSPEDEPIDPNRSEYVFIGKVVGKTPRGDYRIESSPLDRYTVGLKIEVIDAVNLPAKPASSYGLFPSRTMADCSEVGLSESEVDSQFPLGSEILVIGEPIEFLNKAPVPGAVIIKSKFLASNKGLKGGSLASPLSVLDAASFVSSAPDRFEAMFLNYGVLLLFEVRRDRFRFAAAKSDDEKRSVLTRLVLNPVNRFDSIPLLREYFEDEKVILDILEKQVRISNAWDLKRGLRVDPITDAGVEIELEKARTRLSTMPRPKR